MGKFKSKNKNKNTNSLPEKIFPKIKTPSFFKKLKWLDPFTYVDLFVMPKIKSRTESKSVEAIINVVFAALFAGVLYFVLGIIFGTASPLVIVYSESMEPVFFRGDVMGLTSANANTFFGEEVILNQKISGVPVENYVIPTYNESGSLISLKIGEKNIEYKKDGSTIVYPTVMPGIPSYNGKPIIHRSIVKIIAEDGIFVLTKGDNELTNVTFDQDCGKVDILRGLPEQGKMCITLYAIPIESIQGVAFFQIPKIGCVKLWLFDDLFSLIFFNKLPADFKGIC
jgi:signal peptidase I